MDSCKEIKEKEIVNPSEVHELAVKSGWYDRPREVPELLCLIHSEISEALEGYRNHVPKGEKGWIGDELADAVIRIWDMCAYMDIDIAAEVNQKHAFNKHRDYRHGGKKC
jgi:NTP pyrophosphatase (non-canonical NTP hydrolase)